MVSGYFRKRAKLCCLLFTMASRTKDAMYKNEKLRVRTSSEMQKSRVFRGCFTVFSRVFPGFLDVQNENNIHNELYSL